MAFQNILQKSLLFFPKKHRKNLKNLYYDQFLFPFYCLRNKIYYGKKDFFDAVSIETTSYCNLRCKFCPNSKYERGLLKNKKLIPTKLYKNIIDQLAEMDYRGRILPYFFGEPLSDKRLPELIAYTRKKLPKAHIQLNSNGFLFTIPLYEKLVKAGVDVFHVSQYLEKMPPAVKELFDYLKNKPKKENKVSYRIFTDNLARSNRGGNIEVPNQWEKPICTYPSTFLNVDCEGNVILCCADYHSSVKFGNLKKEKIIDIWNKPFYKKIRRDLRKKKFNLPICKKCIKSS